jgi:hypothetical protein
MDELVLDGKAYVGSKRAAQECGYAQDYVGQLARKGFIDAKRVSGQWYVHLDSLRAYKEKAETFKPEPPKYNPDPNVESSINVEGQEFVSAARAAKLAEYNQDYIAQLARAGKIPSKQIGNRWYVEPNALMRHKHEKDAMLRAVQAESVGLKRPEPQIRNQRSEYSPTPKADVPLMTYGQEEKPLFPELRESVALKAVPAPLEDIPVVSHVSRIPIKVLRPITIEAREDILPPKSSERHVAVSRKTRSGAVSWQLAAAAVLLLVVGLGAYKRDVIYSYVSGGHTSDQTAATGSIGGNISTMANKLLTKELIYVRK